MSIGPQLTTPRLLLRRWRDADREPFAAMNADPEVMRHFVSPLGRAESDELMDRIERSFEVDGFGFWALELVSSGELVGFTGVSVPSLEADFMPAVEVGWRLAARFWGNGYATEAARASLDFAFGTAGLAEVVSFTAVTNEPSRALMRRLGMTHDPGDDFDHPKVPRDHILRPHVLYRMGADRWRGLREGEADG